jgi:hypothetical protein
MKYFFFLIVLISFSCHLPKKLEGNYFENINGFCGRTWHFNKDGTFSLNGSCEGDKYIGKGTYEVSNDSIHFFFGDFYSSRDSAHSFVEVMNEKKSLNDSTEIKFEVMDDSTREPVLFPIIVITDSMGKNLAGIQGGTDGRSTLHIGGYKGALKISVSCSGYRSAHYTLTKSGDCTLKISLIWTNGQHPVEEGDFMDFHAKEFGKKIIFRYTFRATVVGLLKEKEKEKEKAFHNKEKLIRK